MEEDQLFELITGSGKNQLQQILDCNNYTKKFGLSLTKEKALQINENRKKTLKKEERVEFGEGILNKLIYIFCDSPYIYQDNYVEMLEGLQDIFYSCKNESLDEVTDDELLQYMKECFDGGCEGDLDYLEGTFMDNFCRKVRGDGFFGVREDEDEL